MSWRPADAGARARALSPQVTRDLYPRRCKRSVYCAADRIGCRDTMAPNLSSWTAEYGLHQIGSCMFPIPMIPRPDGVPLLVQASTRRSSRFSPAQLRLVARLELGEHIAYPLAMSPLV